MRYIGQGLPSLEMFCSLMCLPNPVCQKAYDQINAKIADVSEALANAPMKKAAAEEKNYSCPKLIESGINVTKIAAFIAACEYNDGSKNRIDLMCALNLKINKTNNLNCVNIDKVRKSTAKRQVSETFLEARKAKNLKILKEPEECKLAESNIYAAGAF
ncbi:hypothetical protein TNIN_391051 [Trichonephila inaurata madagascariensis]|uniref:Uncharacterized protein n=1 Tax=Trichonephila inaurata madagascariensis TaxID=2747483 RepID=A0A8X6YVS6_9ARAC|nr:hypothetical protein TNIN_391051 [Trichonephila inaurata madagascariensis]